MTVHEETVKSKSLLEKYDIPINHLDFKYIGKCSNIKEIERIIKILRSGEEGHYPELLKCAEDKLSELEPNSSLLRKQTRVLSKSALDPTQWRTVIEDIEGWQEEIEQMEQSLNKGVVRANNKIYPVVRKNNKMSDYGAKETKVGVEEKKMKCMDYEKWDKFDAEGECTKIDLEDEVKKEEKARREEEEMRRRKRELSLEEEERAMAEIRNNILSMSEVEKTVYAMKEKELGNEYYKTNDLEKAIKYYTRSIAIMPTPVAYNNRAATYLKQCKYSKALDDTNMVLQMDPNNVKAYYRRALSLQHKNEFHKALDDIRQVLMREPNHVVARHIADQLREHCYEMPRKCKLMVKDDSNKSVDGVRVVEVTEDEMLRDYKDKEFVEVNDWGLAKIMCNCNGKYTNDPGIRHDDRVRFQHLNSRKSESGQRGSGRRVEIVEVERIPESAIVGAGEGTTRVEAEEEKEKEVAEEKEVPEEEMEVEESADGGGDGHREREERPLSPEAPPGAAIQVAKKYREKVSKPRQQGPPNGISPFAYSQSWADIIKTNASLEDKAALLRSLKPEQLQDVIGNKLDEVMLSNFVACLYFCFNKSQELELIKDYLIAIMKLKRFSIIYSFLTDKDKSLANELVKLVMMLGPREKQLLYDAYHW